MINKIDNFLEKLSTRKFFILFFVLACIVAVNMLEVIEIEIKVINYTANLIISNL